MNRKKAKAGMSKRPKLVAGERAQDPLLPVVLHEAAMALQDADGRAPGVKFNKLVMDIYWKLSAARNARMHFRIPMRWYLYGAVVDDWSVRHLVRFDHPEEELRTNVVWVAPKPPKVPKDAEGSLEEINRISLDFTRRFSKPWSVKDMLREHYKQAPLPFQRDFLEWSLTTRDIIEGYEADSPAKTKVLFDSMLASYPHDFERRLAAGFERLALYLEPLAHERPQGDFVSLGKMRTTLWDFWSTFCLFLSARYNADLPPGRLESYKERAETELVAYKRRLTAFLEDGYFREQAANLRMPSDLAPMGQFLAAVVREELDR